MPALSQAARTKIHDLAYIVYRNVFLLTNGIIFTVVALLCAFGNVRAGLFLGIISVINISVGLIQDVRSWLALEKLQLLTAPRVIRLDADGSETSVLAEELQKNDRIKLVIGDQIPCDGELVDALGLEINEGLITGESASVACPKGSILFAGSLVTSGIGVLHVNTVLRESRIARMTEGIKKYTTNTSSIQESSERTIKYAGYTLLGILVLVLLRAYFRQEAPISVILTVGTMASLLIPQGLAFMVTVSFAYGAANLYKQHVLLQQVNATEMLGRIKHLCMDKTGTLTQNTLTVEEIHVPNHRTHEEAIRLVAAYAHGTHDTSQIMASIKTFIGEILPEKATEMLAFSSWRKYGAVQTMGNKGETLVLAGAPDTFLPQLRNAEEKQWLTDLIRRCGAEGKHLICMAESSKAAAIAKDLSQETLSVIAVFVFYNNLRPGIQNTIQFFQERGVHIHIISGDHPETVQAVAFAAGVDHTERMVTGKEIATWSEETFDAQTQQYTIFARIAPEQKERIVSAFKKDGFTAMVGDGANDALAIKKADLGIAMFDGAQATRRLAAVVLTNNSFTALPGGVALADGIIRHMEMFASIFIHQTVLAFLLFLYAGLSGRDFPLTPFNITLMNYCIVGLPGLLISYWTVRPAENVHPAEAEPFLKRITPFAATSATLAAVALILIFENIPMSSSTDLVNTVIAYSFVTLCYLFFLFVPSVYYGPTSRPRKRYLFGLGILESLVLFLALQIPFAKTFFNITDPLLPPSFFLKASALFVVFWILQGVLARLFIHQKTILVSKNEPTARSGT